MDYTNSQVQQVEKIVGVPSEHSEQSSEQAELDYKERFGVRTRFTHVKSSSKAGVGFHFSDKWLYFLKFPNNITVFYQGGKPTGWLFHKEIKGLLTPCRFGGYDLDAPMRSMEVYNVGDAK